MQTTPKTAPKTETPRSDEAVRRVVEAERHLLRGYTPERWLAYLAALDRLPS